MHMGEISGRALAKNPHPGRGWSDTRDYSVPRVKRACLVGIACSRARTDWAYLHRQTSGSRPLALKVQGYLDSVERTRLHGAGCRTVITSCALSTTAWG